MPFLYKEHVTQLESLRHNHEINRIEFLQVEHVALVHVHYTRAVNDREFTALITAKARDYYVEDRTGEFLRGDQAPERFQEFWTFRRQADVWLLRDIEQSRDSDYLAEENVVETMSEEQLAAVYAEAAAAAGAAGPWSDNRAAQKQSRIDRLLHHLAERDPLWEPSRLRLRARQVFLDVFMAQERGDPAGVNDAALYPAVADDLRGQIRTRQEQGYTIEFRNLCVRKVELILVRNYLRDDEDEFTVRIRAHAQKIVRKGDRIVSQDDDVRAFEQYWTFGRDGQVWKLKDVLPPARGQEALGADNVDAEV
jgi:predicted lipid-binding transport protein (Tim44 family)